MARAGVADQREAIAMVRLRSLGAADHLAPPRLALGSLVVALHAVLLPVAPLLVLAFARPWRFLAFFSRRLLPPLPLAS